LKARDKRWSLAVKEKYDYLCFYCGAEGTDPAHIIGKGRSKKTRYVLENGICLCRKCHIAFDTDQKFRKHIINVLKDLYQKLMEVKNGRKPEDFGFREVA